jgi:hypothetical protein
MVFFIHTIMPYRYGYFTDRDLPRNVAVSTLAAVPLGQERRKRLAAAVPPARFERRAEFAERCRFPASSFVVLMSRQGAGSNTEADDAGYGVRESH